MTSNFVDYVKIFCRSGKGGKGCMHLLHAAKEFKGGPDGGDGGRGGHIILKGNAQLWTLLHLKYTKHIFAQDGEAGGQNLRHGANGDDRIIEVPLGCVVKDAETGEQLCEITEDGEQKILFSGGRGGKGNDFFKSSTNRIPRFAQPGEEGTEKWVIIELKILADVGLVGFPNAGKSTLLSVVSAAKPEIANYPFTTLVPNLGIVKYRDDKSFVMADIPGIIEGASEGRGLGLRFLRHIERNSILLFMIPCDTERDINEEYNILLNELHTYNPELLHKDRILAITKCDMMDEEMINEMKKNICVDCEVYFISSVAQQGITELKDAIYKKIIAQ
ncbi:MAG: GTPase ObgE [Bacteroidales bacterium]|nr:GTPase ObgE [Bacteroidales bacterium]